MFAEPWHKLWWRLPGPANYLREIVEDLDSGKNVVLCLPDHCGDGLYYALNDELHSVRRKLVPINANGAAPQQVLEQFQVDAHEAVIIWLHGLDDQSWPQWEEFLCHKYQFQMRASGVSRTNCPLFCTPIKGTAAATAAHGNNFLSFRKWHGRVSQLDMVLFTSSLLPATRAFSAVATRVKSSLLLKQIAVWVIAHLAQSDPHVSLRLARQFDVADDLDEALEHILNPGQILKHIAKQRAWAPASAAVCCWHTGMKDHVDGREQIHSAALCLNDGNKEIERRIWLAQVKVIFPLLEEHRRWLVTELDGAFKLPHESSEGKILEASQLELHHIKSQFKKAQHDPAHPLAQMLTTAYETRAIRLAEIRNALSHLEPLSLDLLTCDELAMNPFGDGER